MRFPLADWIDSHSDAPHNLGQSGMRGTLPSLESALQRPEAPDEGALVAQLAELVGVPKERLFLTHGASEGNALVLVFLAHELSGAASRAPRFSVLAPEYPPLSDCAGWAGLRPTGTDGPAEIVALSDPNNPTGVVRRDTDEVRHLGREAKAILVDETFREFTTAASQAATPDPRLWATGTFTKAYGADRIRVGFVVAPEGDRSSFARFHGVMTDEIPPASVASARAILRDRERILAESRARLHRNVAALRAAVDGVPDLAAPVHFDRGPAGIDGDGFAEFALDAGVLVCPGSYFGDPGGVRLCLTQPTFPADLAAYVRVRNEWLDRGVVTPSRSSSRPSSRRSRGAR